ncbi:cell envelope integrity EipB family protein [Bartonella bovis]|uniref:cell envelope integrity EipB family protein n=1 Tax=Bartonella bovis TaxID=155194 RepID=UPI000C9B1C9E|nr:cell envelope integrity EipB family protein [Bartonella bovis]
MIKPLFMIGLYNVLLCSAGAEEPIFLVPHRAVYDFQLESVSNEMSILGVSGRMVYEITGSGCQGYTTRSRFVNRVYMKDAPIRLTDQQIISYETGNGHEYRFNVQNKIGRDVSDNIEGVAKRTKNGIIVKLKKPKDDVYKLATAEFPIMQLKTIIQQAKAARHFYHTAVFDGTGNANEVIKESIVIGDRKELISNSETKKLGKLGEESHWPVTISYFDDAKNKDGLPLYRTNFLLYENGIMRNMLIDYGDFSIRAKLKNFELLDLEKNSDTCKH